MSSPPNENALRHSQSVAPSSTESAAVRPAIVPASVNASHVFENHGPDTMPATKLTAASNSNAPGVMISSAGWSRSSSTCQPQQRRQESPRLSRLSSAGRAVYRAQASDSGDPADRDVRGVTER